MEEPIRRVRAVLESCRWSFRNRARMDLLLELVRLAHLRADDAGVHATDVRAHLTKHGGLPSRRYRALYDSWGPKTYQQRSCSLCSTPAERAAKEVRNAARKQPGRSRVTPVSGQTTTISL